MRTITKLTSYWFLLVKVIVTDVTTVGFELQCIVTDLGELRARQGDEAASGGNHLSHSAQTTTLTITTEKQRDYRLDSSQLEHAAAELASVLTA